MGPPPQQERHDHRVLGPLLDLFHGERWTLRGLELLDRLEQALAAATSALGAPESVPAPDVQPYGLLGPGQCLEVRLPHSARDAALQAFEGLAAALELLPLFVERPWGEELHLLDALGRSWPLGWIDSRPGSSPSGERAEPTLLRACLAGPAEHVLALLLEQGRPFPLWLAPEQVRVIAVSEAHQPYAAAVVGHLRRAGLRVTPQDSDGPLAGRIRAAALEKIPRVAVVGSREAAARTISLGGESMELEAFVSATRAEAQPFAGGPRPPTSHQESARIATVATRGPRTQDRQEDSHRIP